MFKNMDAVVWNNFDSQFFADFPYDTLLRRFSGFTFSAGEFHKIRQIGIFRTAAEKGLSVLADHSGGDVDPFCHDADPSMRFLQ